MALMLYADRHFTSPYAMSVFVALTEKQLPFETRTLDLAASDNTASDYALISLTQRVPTLIDDDFTVSESSAIAEYLEQAYPDPAIYPADLRQRARARQLQAWLRSDFAPLRMERPTPTLFCRPAPAVRVLTQKARGRTTGSAEMSRPSLRGGLTAYSALPGAPGLLATVIRRSYPANLASASGCQDHTT